MKSFSLRSQFVTLNDIFMYPNTAELRGIANFQMRCLAFCFSLLTNCYLLSVIVTLENEKIRFWKLSTVNCNACNAKNDFRKLLYCYIVTLGRIKSTFSFITSTA